MPSSNKNNNHVRIFLQLTKKKRLRENVHHGCSSCALYKGAKLEGRQKMSRKKAQIKKKNNIVIFPPFAYFSLDFDSHEQKTVVRLCVLVTN